MELTTVCPALHPVIIAGISSVPILTNERHRFDNVLYPTLDCSTMAFRTRPTVHAMLEDLQAPRV